MKASCRFPSCTNTGYILQEQHPRLEIIRSRIKRPVAKSKLNKPTDKWNMAKRNSHSNKTPIRQIPQTHHLSLVKFCDGSSEVAVLSLATHWLTVIDRSTPKLQKHKLANAPNLTCCLNTVMNVRHIKINEWQETTKVTYTDGRHYSHCPQQSPAISAPSSEETWPHQAAVKC